MPGGRTLITGCTSGIGRALALALASEHALILHGRDAHQISLLARQCSRPEAHLPWVADLRDPDGAGRSLTRLLASGVQVASLIHCAGVAPISPIRMVKPESVREVFRVNVLSLIAMIQALLASAEGACSLESVVLVSSAASRRGEAGAAVYSASKGALDALVRTLAVDLAPGTRVNAVLPGIVPTAMSRSTLASRDFQERAARRYPLGVGCVGNVVAAITHLISDEAQWTTGLLMNVDGGRTVI